MLRPRLLVGLGNPGPRYRGTRHNLGFDWIDRLAARWGVSMTPWRGGLAELGERAGDDGALHLLKPLTFMNLSGDAVVQAAKKFSVPPGGVLVAYDDHALPLGQVRLRLGGSAGGHNGIASVIERLGTQEVPRLRLGIGPAPSSAEGKDYVLGRFTPAQKAAADEMLERACAAAERALEAGLERAMTDFNRPAAS